ncbi:MAG: hypothetical protein SAJ12_02160 [Jaaginema sp. PMC 1079.18]|nr:hypothetical protein [Jaaginema sp. PMC 1080.18]MEC4849792.1 hypothetical protein [Jaaginema sp. PMC 1079.18]MEC4866874.1 hypothetical protein [Jaaginema sp. PMC 1078.18]
MNIKNIKNIIILALSVLCIILLHFALQRPEPVQVQPTPQRIGTVLGIGAGSTEDEALLNAWRSARQKLDLSGCETCILQNSGSGSSSSGGGNYSVQYQFNILRFEETQRDEE